MPTNYDELKEVLMPVEAVSFNIGLTDNLVTVPHMRITHALARLKELGPDVRIQIRMTPPSEVEQGVLDGSLHVGVVPQSHALSGLEYQPLYGERSQLYCAVGHPLFYVDDQQLTDQRLNAQDAIAPTFRLPPEIQSQYQVLNCTASASDREGMAFLILTGRYIGYLADHYAQQWVQQGRLRVLKPASRFYDLTLASVTRKGRRPQLVLETFLEALAKTG